MRKGRTARARAKPGVVKTCPLAVLRAKVSFRRMFLRQTIRRKDGKEHRYFSVVENKRVIGGRVVQRHVVYLGEKEQVECEHLRHPADANEAHLPRAGVSCSVLEAARNAALALVNSQFWRMTLHA
jgi:hypothetical protein